MIYLLCQYVGIAFPTLLKELPVIIAIVGMVILVNLLILCSSWIEERSESGFKTIYTGDFEADLFRDIKSAKKSVMIAGSYFPPRQMNMLINAAEDCRLNGARFVIVTKRSESPYAQKTEQLLSSRGIEHIVKNRIANSFCIIDGRTVWYSGGELFGKQEDECVLRIEDEVLAGELRESVEGMKV